MAKPKKDAERRAVVEQMRKQQEASERRRTALVVGAVGLAGVGIIAAAAVPLLQQENESSKDLSSIGVAASAAGCQPEVTKPASGNNNHVPAGTVVPYTDAPPAFGPHYDAPQPMTRKFYTVDDRPSVETLVHNSEHGFTLVWYDASLDADEAAMRELRAVADKFPATSGLDDKLLVVPWSTDDGDAFPDGAKIAFTHWTGGSEDEQKGVWRYCDQLSGEALGEFIDTYPFTDAPEGNVPG